MGTTIASTALPGLLQLPPEVRYRIYDFAFQDSDFTFSGSRPWSRYENPPQGVALKTSDYPIRLTETCHLLHDEVAEYAAYHSKANMTVDTNGQQFAIQNFIPGRFVARITCLDTNYTVMEQNLLLNIEFLPSLQSLNLHLGTTLNEAELENLVDFGISANASKHQNVNRYVAQCFSDFEGCKTLIKYCRKYDINSAICFRACFAFNTYVQEIHDVELRNNCDQEQELMVTKERFKSLQEFDELRRGEIYVYGDSDLVRTSLWRHAKLLREVVSATGRRKRA
jgi:hypothetical protein